MIGLAILVFGISAILDTLVSRALSGLAGDNLSDKGLTLAVSLLTGPLSFSTAGLVLYAGMLDRVVGHHLHGHEHVTVRGALRTLPWTRLLVADALLVAATTIGAALFVVPGSSSLRSSASSGRSSTSRGSASSRRSAVRPRSSAERRGPRSCSPPFRRMSRSRLVHGFQFATAEQPYLTAFVVSAVIGATVGATVGLFEVTLSYELLHAERAAAGEQGRSDVSESPA